MEAKEQTDQTFFVDGYNNKLKFELNYTTIFYIKLNYIKNILFINWKINKKYYLVKQGRLLYMFSRFYLTHKNTIIFLVHTRM